jgi:hypothetical protein
MGTRGTGQGTDSLASCNEPAGGRQGP